MNFETEQDNEGEPPVVTRLLFWFTACYCVSFVSFLETSQGLWFWYVSSRRPVLNPPNWAIEPIWTLAYGLMAWASWLIWIRESSRSRTWGLGLFGANLMLNMVWPWLFFMRHTAVWTVVVMAVLCVTAIANVVVFWRMNTRAGALLLAPTAWLVFLTLLYTDVWRINR